MLKFWKGIYVFTILTLAAGLGPVIAPVLVSPVQADGWVIQTVTEAGSVMGDASLALDSDGYPHIVCANSGGGALLYVSYNGSAWSVQTVTGTDNVSSDYDIALALDTYNHPHISYYDFHYGFMKYATSSDGITWDVQTVDSAGETSRLGWYNSIAVGSDNKPHISYYDNTYYYTGSNHYLKYANYYSGAWHPVNVVTSGYNGQYNSIAVDSNNNPHISYFDGNNHRLRYVSCNSGSWGTPVTVDVCEIGWPTSLAMDDNNNPHICYWDSVNARLKYASYNTVSGWTNGFVAPTNTVGAGSLALDSNGAPHISCNDRGNGNLEYISLNGSTWNTPEVVDSTVNVGYDTSLAIDDDNNPHIAYWDSTTHFLKYATYTITPPVLTGKIAFISSRDDNNEIYVMNADGSGQTRITNNPAADEYPAWSPDGNKIAFQSNRDGNTEIYIMNADGSDQTRLTINSAYDANPAWSPDGAKITFQSDRDGTSQIYVMDASNGSNQTRLTSNSAYDKYPKWSPDGTKIVFDSNRLGEDEIYVMDATNGSGQTNITNNPGGDLYPAWSPNGARIAFYSTRDINIEIYAMNAADGSNQARLTNNSGSDAYPSWSPDSAMITFQSDRDGNREIYVMKADGSSQVNISNNAADDRYPVWSAGPTVITFTAEPSSIFADGISTSNLTAIVKDPEGNPVADGTNVMFTTSRGAVGSKTVTKPTSSGIATATLTSENSTQIVVADVSAAVNGISKTIAVFFTPPSSPPITDNQTETVIGYGVISGTSTGGSVTVDATGSHTITTAQYGDNPGGAPSFEVSGNYYDVHVDNTVDLNRIVIQFSPAAESTVIYYWNGSDWLPASNQVYAGSIVTVTVTSATYPSLVDLSGLFFGSGTPLETEPAVINTGATSIMATTAILNGNLTSDGDAATTVIIYGGTIDGETPPSRPGNWTRTENIGVRPEGAFSLGITGLSPNTKYYYRCYATSSGGSSWATSSADFTTQPSLGLWRNYWAGPGKDWLWFSSGGP